MHINLLVWDYYLTLYLITNLLINNVLYFNLTICYDNCNYRNL